MLAEAGTAAVVLAMTAGLVGLQPARQAEVAPTAPTAPTAPAGPAAPLDRSEYNEVDMIFVAAMAPHHAEGLWLTDTALRAGLPPAAASLAVQLRTHYQSDEPELEGLLAGFAAGADSGGGHGHGADGDDVPQGLTPAQQSALEAASGAAVERAFLELVVAHHVAGLASAASELRYGDHPPTVRLAERLRDASDRQLAEARALLDAVQTG